MLILEVAGVVGFFVLAGLVAHRLSVRAAELEHERMAWLVGAALVAGLLAADFVSGLVHWAADNWGEETWPVVGPAFIRPFRHHHIDPLDITRHGFFELNGNNCIVSLPVLGFAWFWAATALPESAMFWSAFCLALTACVFGTNQFHAWAHTDVPPAPVAWLQRARLILSKPNHDVHHVPPHDRNYCITTGWLNGPLTWIHFFPALEALITTVTGARPKHIGATAT